MACKGIPSVSLSVKRTNGLCGEISCSYHTQDGTAMDGADYYAQDGQIIFQNGVASQTIRIPLITTSHSDERRFRILLDNASTGVKFDATTDGGETGASCEIILASTGGRMPACGSCVNPHRTRVGCKSYTEQVISALYCGGSAEEQSQASRADWFNHCLSLFWKVLFAAVPPPVFCGGWLCFGAALTMIGAVTAVVGDMAGLLGCCLGIPDDITAITIVALGTSLPDTFASKTAAQQDETADNSIGNVTGSNSVNVFLGLGLPWTIGAIYWAIQGPTDEWKEHLYKGDTYDKLFGITYSEGGFMVPAGSLSMSVMTFTATALTCIALLMFRRKAYGGELGGPKSAQTRDGCILVGLWLVYIVVSIVISLGSQ
eukprot:gnl/TRDRNA2_/TRDRNA2_170193_c1_seq1.p1 gnl/TRDRNA2_/TRDRNA2_170193_c1~~gnl/TRDRNA2_/TRDRNA2_170193_c1_seq1.p1  ORF type:complete len:434 (-),score=61.76 gnl/TRDRNA2_/TRDRNA2_170193_c1_seq1:56-1174(-)